MFATYLANTIVFVVGTATEVEIPIGFSVALACVLANRLCLNTRGLVRRSRFSSSSLLSSSAPATTYTRPAHRPHTNHRDDGEESWEDGFDSEDAEYEEYDGYGGYEYGSGEGDGSSGQHIVSTPARSPRATEVGVEGGERLDAIQMRELRRMRSSRRLGGGWGGGRWIGRREPECGGVGVVTV